jgi:hypothetical protein
MMMPRVSRLICAKSGDGDKMRTKTILRGIFITWLVLWAVFLVRQSKRGQYAELAYFYTNDYSSRVGYLLGDDLADIVVFCLENIPPGSTYDIRGFERFSIKEVRARYYLWPLFRTEEDPDFIIVYGSAEYVEDGYREFRSFDGMGKIYVREDAV